jgi:siroheme synthase
MVELNVAQHDFLKAMSSGQPVQLVVRAKNGDPIDRAEMYARVNAEVDALITAGLVLDVTQGVNRPASVDREFRLLALTVLGQSMFSGPEVAQA